MTPGPIIPTAGEVAGHEAPVCWVLTNEQHLDVPEGFAVAAGAVRRALVPGAPEVTVKAAMWDQWQAAGMWAVLLVSSVATSVTSTGGPLEPTFSHLCPRSSKCWRMDGTSRLRLKAVQRWAGEAYAVPLKISDAEAASRTYLGASLRPRACLLGEWATV